MDAPTKVLFYEEWDDQWGSQKLTGERFDSGYLTRWFGAEGSAMGFARATTSAGMHVRWPSFSQSRGRRTRRW